MIIFTIKKFKKPLICFALALISINGNAQTTLLQNTIDKLEGYKNYSYQCTEKILPYNTDTIIKQHNDAFQKAPDDKKSGYLFTLETRQIGNSYHLINIYNGQNLIVMTPNDSTYHFADIKKYNISSTLPGFLNWLRGRPEKKPSEMTGDTIINGFVCSHLIFHTSDTIINNEHYYTNANVFIDKISGLPNLITLREKFIFSGNVVDYYTAYYYSNYKLNEKGVEIANTTAPGYFHLPVKKVALPPLLTPGTVAPNWTLYATDGKQVSLAQLKGKVVLMDFFFIGCGSCMESLQSLERIYGKFKDENFVMVSISDRDSRKAVTGFKKNYDIKNTVCGDGADVAQAYHLPGAPLFYFIDKEGRIGNVQYGYYNDFEEKAASTINKLLNK